MPSRVQSRPPGVFTGERTEALGALPAWTQIELGGLECRHTTGVNWDSGGFTCCSSPYLSVRGCGC